MHICMYVYIYVHIYTYTHMHSFFFGTLHCWSPIVLRLGAANKPRCWLSLAPGNARVVSSTTARQKFATSDPSIIATTVSETWCALHAPLKSAEEFPGPEPIWPLCPLPYLILNHWTLPVSLPKEGVLPTPLPGRSDSSRTSAHTQYNAVYTDHHSRIQAACGPLPDTQVHKGYQFGGHSPHMADTMCSLIQNTGPAW